MHGSTDRRRARMGRNTPSRHSRQDYAKAWLQGFNGVPIASVGRAKPVSNTLESELDEAAVSKPSADRS